MGLFKPNIEKLLRERDFEGLCSAARKSYEKRDYKTCILAIRALGALGDPTAIIVFEELINHSMNSKTQAQVGVEAMHAFGELGEIFYAKRLLYAMNRIQYGEFFGSIEEGFVEAIQRMYWKADDAKKTALVETLESLLNDPQKWIAPGMDFAFELIEKCVYSTMDPRAVEILEGRLAKETDERRIKAIKDQVDKLKELASYAQ